MHAHLTYPSIHDDQSVLIGLKSANQRKNLLIWENFSVVVVNRQFIDNHLSIIFVYFSLSLSLSLFIVYPINCFLDLYQRQQLSLEDNRAVLNLRSQTEVIQCDFIEMLRRHCKNLSSHSTIIQKYRVQYHNW